MNSKLLPSITLVSILAVALPPRTFAGPMAASQRLDSPTPEGLHAVGPPLTALRTKLADPNWLVAWLLKPSHLRRRPLMRDFRLSVTEARVLAKALYAGTPVRSTVRWRGGDARLGEKLFVTRGCRGCHAVQATEMSVSPRVPNLAGIGIKVRGDWLFNWLKSPRSYDPDTAMPQLALSDDEIRHLVAFLLLHREGAEVVAAAPRFDPRVAPDEASAVLKRFDCAKCHLIRGFQTVQPTNGPPFVPRACANCHEPAGSSVSRSQMVAEDSDLAETALQSGRLLVAYYNCRGCHRIEGSGGAIAEFLERKTLAPPTLDGEGARVQTSWLIDFSRHPRNLRPWLQMRMPDYGFSDVEANALAKYFAALAHVSPVDEAHEDPPRETTTLGQRRFAHFKCLQCHPASAANQPPAGVDPEDLSINLTLTKMRLRPSWVRDFLARPKAVVGTQTRMPAVFYSSDGIPQVDDPDRDIAAITAYLFVMTEAASSTSATDQPLRRAEPTPPIDWSTYAY